MVSLSGEGGRSLAHVFEQRELAVPRQVDDELGPRTLRPTARVGPELVQRVVQRAADVVRSPSNPLAWTSPPGLSLMPSSRIVAVVFRTDGPCSLCRLHANASARGPTCAAAAPVASEVCRGWRPRTRRPQLRQRAHFPLTLITTARTTGSSSWYCSQSSSLSSSSPPQPGQASGSSATNSSSTRSGACRCACRACCSPDRRPGGRPLGFRFPRENGAACRLAARCAASS